MHNKKILIVDDEKEILDLLFQKLTQTGYQVVKAVNGKEALLKAKTYSPDLILLDIVLPDIDGADVAKLLEEDPVLRKIPLLFMSGIVSKDDGVKSYVTVGGTKYTAIPKPFNYEEMLSEIQEILE